MAQLDKVLLDLITPMVDDKDSLSVLETVGSDEKEIILTVTAKSSDTARLIGRKGSMASALRQVMSVASHRENKKVSIKFEEIQ